MKLGFYHLATGSLHCINLAVHLGQDFFLHMNGGSHAVGIDLGSSGLPWHKEDCARRNLRINNYLRFFLRFFWGVGKSEQPKSFE